MKRVCAVCARAGGVWVCVPSLSVSDTCDAEAGCRWLVGSLVGLMEDLVRAAKGAHPGLWI